MEQVPIQELEELRRIKQYYDAEGTIALKKKQEERVYVTWSLIEDYIEDNFDDGPAAEVIMKYINDDKGREKNLRQKIHRCLKEFEQKFIIEVRVVPKAGHGNLEPKAD